MLTDDDWMTSGKHIGKKMKDVPADYLLWLADNLKSTDRWMPVLEYIEKNRAALEAEVKEKNQ